MLSTLGGNLEQTIRLIWKKLLHPNIQYLYNWTGLHGKEKLSTCVLNIIVKDVVKSIFPKSTDLKYEKVTKSYFQKSGNRKLLLSKNSDAE